MGLERMHDIPTRLNVRRNDRRGVGITGRVQPDSNIVTTTPYFKEHHMGFFSEIGNAVSGAVDAAQHLGNDVADAVQAGANAVADAAGAAASGAGEAADAAAEAASRAAAEATRAAIEIATGVIDAGIDVAKNVYETGKDGAEFIWDRAWRHSPEENFNDAAVAGGRIVELGKHVAQDVIEQGKSAAEHVIDTTRQVVDTTIDEGAKAAEWAYGKGEQGAHWLADKTQDTVETGLKTIDDAKQTAQDAAERLYTKSPEENLQALLDAIRRSRELVTT
jgi:hypothetical protein